jgi:hypothetical protein
MKLRIAKTKNTFNKIYPIEIDIPANPVAPNNKPNSPKIKKPNAALIITQSFR